MLIAGPTASGKSALALTLAERHNGIIINTDSMQVYRELPILSARPGPEETQRVPHLLYGHIAATDLYSVGRYADDAKAALQEARRIGRMPIFVGGTGMYFMALTDGLAEMPAIPEEIRAACRAELARGAGAEHGITTIHKKLAAVDPETAAGLNPTDTQRVLRAWEVWLATGKPLKWWQAQKSTPVLDGMKLAKFAIDIPRPLLRERIAIRFHQMMKTGAVEEAMKLKDLDPALPAAKMLGVRELVAYSEGRMTKEEAAEKAITATRQFAKRQCTWTRHRMAEWTWLHPFGADETS